MIPFRSGFAFLAACLALPVAPVQAHTALTPPSARPALDTDLALPVQATCISSPFGPRVLPNHPLAGTFHNGIDLPAPAGAPVRAIAPGEVIRAQRRGPGGLELLVQHHGFVAVYSHLGSVAPRIAEGHRAVKAGQEIGVVGHSGVMYGMHLFFAMERDGHFVDPAPYLRLALCHGAVRRRSDMLAGDGKIPPTRHFTEPHARYAQR